MTRSTLRFASWLLTQEQNGTSFTDEQRQWLTWMKENIAAEMGITAESFRVHAVC